MDITVMQDLINLIKNYRFFYAEYAACVLVGGSFMSRLCCRNAAFYCLQKGTMFSHPFYYTTKAAVAAVVFCI
jgi:hypothetical protein